jgi:DNA-binding transcriptional LysR family regulator
MFLMSYRNSWENQQAFLAVFDTGSLSGAARRLRVAQPTVRTRIAALERDLGTVLFTRSVNGLAATEHARALADAARAMEKASEAFVRAASAPPGRLAGTVRLSVAEFVGIEVLPPMLAQLREAYPAIAIEVSVTNLPADLLSQEVDIAVRMHPPRQKALVAKKTGTIPLGFFAHRDYLARRGMPRNMEELLTHDVIGPDRTPSDLRQAAALDPRLTRRFFAIRTDSHPAQLALARAGLGVAFVQRPVGLADPHLRPVLPDFKIGSLDTWVVTHEDLRRVPRVRVVFDHLVLEFKRYMRTA